MDAKTKNFQDEFFKKHGKYCQIGKGGIKITQDKVVVQLDYDNIKGALIDDMEIHTHELHDKKWYSKVLTKGNERRIISSDGSDTGWVNSIIE